MKQVLIISGKGGTGKTALTASFAVLAGKKVTADCDVDAADMHLLMHPRIREKHEFRSGFKAVTAKDKCQSCGLCRNTCRFQAIREDFTVDPLTCEGCGLCARVCPAGAIHMEENRSGEWFLSDTPYGTLVHAKLGIAEENSGKLVVKVRQAAKEAAEEEGADFILIDGPPGIGCPVIASLGQIDLAVVVTEPTLSGLHDLLRVEELTKHFKVKTGVVINKYDINPQVADEIESACRKRGTLILGRIPFSESVSHAIVAGIPPVSYRDPEISERITAVWEKIKQELV